MSTITTTVPTCLGTLINLPPELRDQIYDHVFDYRYAVFWTFYRPNRYPSLDGNRPLVFSDLEIHLVSKTLSAEASARLFSTATIFTYYISFLPCEDVSRPPLREVTAKMTNVEFVVRTGAEDEGFFSDIIENGWAFYDLRTEEDYIIPMVTASGEVKGRQTNYHRAAIDPKCEASVDHFTGTAIERNSLLITFRDFNASFKYFMATRFFQTLKMCLGFRTITVDLEWWDVEYKVMNVDSVMETIEEVRMELEPCWGPCEVQSVLGLREKQPLNARDKLHFNFRLVFRPLVFRGQDMKAAGAGMVKEIDRLEA